MSQHQANQEIFEYDGRLLAVLSKLQDTVSSYAIQNYSACGAVLFFHFTSTNKLPFWVVTVLVIALCVNFCLAIATNLGAAEKLYAAHRIAVEQWFTGKTKDDLYKALSGDASANEILKRDPSFSFVVAHPAVIANAIPAIGVLILLAAGFR
jgi:hypothetical protein